MITLLLDNNRLHHTLSNTNAQLILYHFKNGVIITPIYCIFLLLQRFMRFRTETKAQRRRRQTWPSLHRCAAGCDLTPCHDRDRHCRSSSRSASRAGRWAEELFKSIHGVFIPRRINESLIMATLYAYEHVLNCHNL